MPQHFRSPLVTQRLYLDALGLFQVFVCFVAESETKQSESRPLRMRP